jgi:hypothetical protein
MMKSLSALGMIAAATLFSLHWSSAKSLSLSVVATPAGVHIGTQVLAVVGIEPLE